MHTVENPVPAFGKNLEGGFTILCFIIFLLTCWEICCGGTFAPNPRVYLCLGVQSSIWAWSDSKVKVKTKPGGLDLCRLCLNRDSRSRQLGKSEHFQKVGLDNWDWDFLILSRQYFSIKIEIYQDLSRLFRFLWISQLLFNLGWEINPK
jgi:hypothetical protein